MSAQVTTALWEESFRHVREAMLQTGDTSHADKMAELLEKWEQGKLAVAFCGHFSAGKSTMVNRLCGAALLPSSPIPTSANLVTIQNGTPEARVRIRTESGTAETLSVPVEQLEAYCKNGDSIETVDIRYPVDLLGEQMMLLDTPGIDSTDDAHKLATESALHLADVVFYMMDYNHVQSEINFEFTKRLQEWGKPLYLIVNQIDKHSDAELSFKDYKQSVEDAFAQWNIRPEGILFTTLRGRTEDGRNDWDRLLWLLGELKLRSEPLRRSSLLHSSFFVVNEHADLMEQRHAFEKQKLLQETGDLAEAEGKADQLAEIHSRIRLLKERTAQAAGQWKARLTGLLDNANLTPAPMRDLAHSYLESRKPGFKTGLLFSAGKTAVEKERREEAFYADVMERVKANVDWHVRDWLRESSKEAGTDYEEYVPVIDPVISSITKERMGSLVQPGAGFTAEYTMNYCKLLSESIKSSYRQAGLEMIEELSRHAKQNSQEEMDKLKDEAAALSIQLGSLNRYKELAAEERDYRTSMESFLKPLAAGGQGGPDLPDWSAYVPGSEVSDGADNAVFTGSVVPTVALGESEDAPDAAGKYEGAEESGEDQTDLSGRLKGIVSKLRSGAALVEGIPSMQLASRSLLEKAEQLENNRFTIALFGAFSAGKSSFANALVGERILPVSPNPTTAAINKIVPPDSEWPHGTAKVKLKSREAVIDDIRFSLEALGLTKSESEDFLKAIGRLTPDRLAPRGKPHYAFLKAVERGWGEAERLLGSELRVQTLPEFEAYVAEEQKSCFVEWIELHYDCPLTRQGIVLVDTPGADSINARHTGVAFNYIKNADAILFVTYYNHAFSQADREFLLQLGRVKESFELDKMFFLVNAADLASSQEELEAVVEHVRSNLLAYGIRQSRIYPLSSKQGVEAKLAGDAGQLSRSGLAAFERQFFAFAFGELADLAVNAAESELARLAERLGRWLSDARLGDAAREAKLAALASARGEGERRLEELSRRSRERELRQEIGELLHYVKQRVEFRFGDFYNAAFHPSTLQDDGRDLKQALRSCWKELIRLLSYDLSQEVLATTLRIENFMHKEAQELYAEMVRQMETLFDGFQAAPYTLESFSTPEIEESLPEAVQAEKVMYAHFKSAKSFFEGEGKQKLRHALEEVLRPTLTAFAEQHSSLLMDAYSTQLANRIHVLAEELKEEAAEFISGAAGSLDSSFDLSDIGERHAKLLQLSDRKL
ncbi:dynamin family protein [Paenibacillus gansuensis]|uniref:Dynamin family protein n=1 Tax=Paenibacillus gansuensis TaxID=306542 RepID=A0ABW5PA62_9BACL